MGRDLVLYLLMLVELVGPLFPMEVREGDERPILRQISTVPFVALLMGGLRHVR